MAELAPPLTVGQLRDILNDLDPDAKVVFTEYKCGDFDVTEFTGAHLSEDNFNTDFRPIFRLQKRRD